MQRQTQTAPPIGLIRISWEPFVKLVPQQLV